MNMIKATANQRNSGGMAEVMSQALITGLEALLRNSRLADGPPAVVARARIRTVNSGEIPSPWALLAVR